MDATPEFVATTSSSFSVALFRDHPAEGWPSMERYAHGLIDGLQGIAPVLSLHVCTPPDPWRLPWGLFLRRLWSYPGWARRLQQDVNHVLDHSYGHLLFALDPERTVVTVHDIAPLLFPGKRLGLSGLAWRWAWRGTLRAACLITDSEFMRRTLLEQWSFSPKRVVAIPVAVDPHFGPLPEKALQAWRRRYAFPDTPLLLHVGHTQPRKNLEGLLHALALLRRRNAEVVVFQVGGTPTPRQAALIESLGLQEAIRFLGSVADSELVALYNLADVFIFPSFYEGFGLPPLEAMACGTPVVVSNAASLPEVVGDAGLLVDPHEPESIAEAVGQVLQDPELAEELRQKGLKRAQQFTWKRTAEETLAVYQAVVQKQV